VVLTALGTQRPPLPHVLLERYLPSYEREWEAFVVSRFYERIERAEQLIPAALEAMRVLTDPAETGAVTLALPEDVQAEGFEVPAAFTEPRTWTVYRQPPAQAAIVRAAELIRSARRPLIVAGGRVIYSEAVGALRALVDATGIPVSETQGADGPVVVYIETDRCAGVPNYESWWDVPVAEVSAEDGVRAVRADYERARRAQRIHLEEP
jgi:TPP-dependent trihydroxycyclohexane-1,2-dione (THcHDO) dehydratase